MHSIEGELNGVLEDMPEWMRPAFLRLCEEGSSDSVVRRVMAGRVPHGALDGCVVVELVGRLACERVAFRAMVGYLMDAGELGLLAGAVLAANEAVERAAR